MRVWIKSIALGALLLLGLLGSAQVEWGRDQRVRVIADLEPSKIRIGEQATLRVRLVFPKESIATLTLPEDTLVQGVEILSSNVTDSASISDEIREMVYSVTLTAFDSATYQLNNIRAVVGGELYSTEDAPLLMVETVPVDLDHPESYADIKGQWKPAFVWQDYLMYLYLLLLLILLGAGGYLGYRWWRRRQALVASREGDQEKMLDPYEEALQSIMNLKTKALWEHNQVKEYYTELTEIIRRYLWRVYQIPTAERTSEEILEAFRNELGRERMYEELRHILTTSDLAKFAKYKPDADANVSLLFATQAFIEEHRPMAGATAEGGEVTEAEETYADAGGDEKGGQR